MFSHRAKMIYFCNPNGTHQKNEEMMKGLKNMPKHKLLKGK